MNKSNPPTPTPHETLLWIESERPFALAFLVRHYSQISREDAEDIFNDFCQEQWELGGDGIKVLRRGVLVQRLRWRARDFIEHQQSAYQGGGAKHEEISEVQERIWDESQNPLALVYEAGERQLLRELLSQVIGRCNFRQSIFAEVVLEALKVGRAISHWSEAFSPEQRAAFMRSSRGGIADERMAFRREVNRTCRQVTAKLQALFRTNHVRWPN